MTSTSNNVYHNIGRWCYSSDRFPLKPKCLGCKCSCAQRKKIILILKVSSEILTFIIKSFAKNLQIDIDELMSADVIQDIISAITLNNT
ncbi:CLUMA_CG012227, isoform A [Clunio marinus]|uniref:CLUMA_CG012227, isoform A n=1 Tax=Clunio marinus TaxID=568069 RepID=A0A1J1IF97_9DIPT|nr:CLUMA_CG012227, isoform A [Clunio marinus]